MRKENFHLNTKYWCAFIGDGGNLARFFACYKANTPEPIDKATTDILPLGFPNRDKIIDKNWNYKLGKTEYLNEYED
ncbi:MAG: hypothetical protein ACI376_00775 [Candidatus Bruticola sp.]